jgi:hypothetical protein
MEKQIFLLLIILIIFVNAQECLDKSCFECSKDGSYCYQCKNGFIKHYARCGKKCNSIVNCNLCNSEETKCIKCKSNCIFNGIYCDCTERYVLGFVLCFFSISMISIIIFCLIHTSWRTRLSRYGFGLGQFNQSRYPLPEETSVQINNKIIYTQMINDFNKNKIEVDKDIENKKCYICKNNNCNLKMGCGCFICFECEKKCVKANICLNCNKNITTMQQVSCSICFGNNKEISTFNCPCKTVVCKECYLKWRKQNNFCPSCRGPIM